MPTMQADAALLIVDGSPGGFEAGFHAAGLAIKGDRLAVGAQAGHQFKHCRDGFFVQRQGVEVWSGGRGYGDAVGFHGQQQAFHTDAHAHGRGGGTPEFGHEAVVNKMHMHDVHATILHALGLDHEKLTYRHAGRDFRLTDVEGHVVKDLFV